MLLHALTPQNVAFVKGFEKLQNNPNIYKAWRHQFAYVHANDPCSDFRPVLIINFDSQNLDPETILFQLSVKLAKIWRSNNRFLHDGILTCINMSRGDTLNFLTKSIGFYTFFLYKFANKKLITEVAQ